MRRVFSPHLLSGLWAALIAFALLSPPGVYEDSGAWARFLAEWGGPLDKVVHGGLFAVMAFLAARSLDVIGARYATLAACVGASLYGAALDVAQSLVPGRATEGLDMLANTVGAVLGAIIFSSLKPRHRS